MHDNSTGSNPVQPAQDDEVPGEAASEADRFATEYADFVTETNRRIERDGLPLEEWRMF